MSEKGVLRLWRALFKARGVAIVAILTVLCLGTRMRGAVLEWDLPADASVSGFKVYLGTSSRQYTQSINAGMRTNVSVTNLDAGITYFLAATAYDTNGVESEFSEEIIYTPAVDGTNSFSIAARFQFSTNVSVRFSAPTAHRCWVASSTDLRIWKQVYALTSTGSQVQYQYTEPFVNGEPKMFYRVIAAQP